MNRDDSHLEAWRVRRRSIGVPDGFADRVMTQVRERAERRDRDAPRRWTSSPWLRAAAVLGAVAAGLTRLGALAFFFDLF